MNILLIAPASGPWRGIDRHTAFNGKTFRFSMLSLLTVAALSPRDAKVTVIDEQVENIPDDNFDLVGITAMTALAPRAYELSAQFRARGIPVVMGGFHATLNPQEVLEHVDAIVEGPATGAWERVCEDVRHGRLQRRYRGDSDAPFPKRLPRELLASRHYQSVNATVATMGCRNHCHFCSINAFHGGNRFTRPVADVVAEVAEFSKGLFVFVDDNLTQDRAYALELFRTLAPLKRHWVVQASIAIAEDAELVSAMADGGCMGVFVGLETFSAEALAQQDKEFNKPQQYRDAVRTLHRNGMFVEAGVIVGFDADQRTVFRDTLRLLDWAGIDAIQLAILTPLPGTPLYTAMKERIIDDNWEHYDYRHAVFTPKNMTAAELQDGADWMVSAFYSPGRMVRRFCRWVAMPRGLRTCVYPLALNLAYYGRVRRFRIQGYDPGTTKTPARHIAASPPRIHGQRTSYSR